MMTVLMLVLGLLAGAIGAWFFLQSKFERDCQQTKSESAVLSERLQGKDQQLQAFGARVQQMEEQQANLRLQLTQESQLRAAAEERNTQIPKLQEEMHAKATQAAALQQEVMVLKSREA